MPKSVDANQKQIAAALVAVGCGVESLHEVGGGVPDLLIGFRGGNYLIEVKNPDTGGTLSKRQQQWHKEWAGEVATVYTIDEAYDAIGLEVT